MDFGSIFHIFRVVWEDCLHGSGDLIELIGSDGNTKAGVLGEESVSILVTEKRNDNERNVLENSFCGWAQAAMGDKDFNTWRRKGEALIDPRFFVETLGERRINLFYSYG